MRSQTKVKAPATHGGHQTNAGQAIRSAPSLPDPEPTVVFVALGLNECTPNCLCALSTPKRCRCACQGTMHGALLWQAFTPNKGVTK